MSASEPENLEDIVRRLRELIYARIRDQRFFLVTIALAISYALIPIIFWPGADSSSLKNFFACYVLHVPLYFLVVWATVWSRKDPEEDLLLEGTLKLRDIIGVIITCLWIVMIPLGLILAPLAQIGFATSLAVIALVGYLIGHWRLW